VDEPERIRRTGDDTRVILRPSLARIDLNMIENRIERAGQLLDYLFDVSGIDVERRREQRVITFYSVHNSIAGVAMHPQKVVSSLPRSMITQSEDLMTSLGD